MMARYRLKDLPDDSERKAVALPSGIKVYGGVSEGVLHVLAIIKDNRVIVEPRVISIHLPDAVVVPWRGPETMTAPTTLDTICINLDDLRHVGAILEDTLLPPGRRHLPKIKRTRKPKTTEPAEE